MSSCCSYITPSRPFSGIFTTGSRQFVVTSELFTFHMGSGPGGDEEVAKSLYPTSMRSAAPAVFGSNRICQYDVLAEKKATLTPALIALWTAACIPIVRYSS